MEQVCLCGGVQQAKLASCAEPASLQCHARDMSSRRGWLQHICLRSRSTHELIRSTGHLLPKGLLGEKDFCTPILLLLWGHFRCSLLLHAVLASKEKPQRA